MIFYYVRFSKFHQISMNSKHKSETVFSAYDDYCKFVRILFALNNMLLITDPFVSNI